MVKLRELPASEAEAFSEVTVETYGELLAAHKELAEISESSVDKLAFLSQGSRLADKCLCLYDEANEQNLGNFNLSKGAFLLEQFKWMLSYAWNCGV